MGTVDSDVLDAGTGNVAAGGKDMFPWGYLGILSIFGYYDS